MSVFIQKKLTKYETLQTFSKTSTTIQKFESSQLKQQEYGIKVFLHKSQKKTHISSFFSQSNKPTRTKCVEDKETLFRLFITAMLRYTSVVLHFHHGDDGQVHVEVHIEAHVQVHQRRVHCQPDPFHACWCCRADR